MLRHWEEAADTSVARVATDDLDLEVLTDDEGAVHIDARSQGATVIEGVDEQRIGPNGERRSGMHLDRATTRNTHLVSHDPTNAAAAQTVMASESGEATGYGARQARVGHASWENAEVQMSEREVAATAAHVRGSGVGVGGAGVRYVHATQAHMTSRTTDRGESQTGFSAGTAYFAGARSRSRNTDVDGTIHRSEIGADHGNVRNLRGSVGGGMTNVSATGDFVGAYRGSSRQTTTDQAARVASGTDLTTQRLSADNGSVSQGQGNLVLQADQVSGDQVDAVQTVTGQNAEGEHGVLLQRVVDHPGATVDDLRVISDEHTGLLDVEWSHAETHGSGTVTEQTGDGANAGPARQVGVLEELRSGPGGLHIPDTANPTAGLQFAAGDVTVRGEYEDDGLAVTADVQDAERVFARGTDDGATMTAGISGSEGAGISITHRPTGTEAAAAPYTLANGFVVVNAANRRVEAGAAEGAAAENVSATVPYESSGEQTGGPYDLSALYEADGHFEIVLEVGGVPVPVTVTLSDGRISANVLPNIPQAPGTLVDDIVFAGYLRYKELDTVQGLESLLNSDEASEGSLPSVRSVRWILDDVGGGSLGAGSSRVYVEPGAHVEGHSANLNEGAHVTATRLGLRDGHAGSAADMVNVSQAHADTVNVDISGPVSSPRSIAVGATGVWANAEWGNPAALERGRRVAAEPPTAAEIPMANDPLPPGGAHVERRLQRPVLPRPKKRPAR